jgi:hypothetical protein
MATSLLIAPAFFKQISEEQVLTWRQETYSKIFNNMLYSKNDILALKKSPIMSFEKIKESIKNRLIMCQSTGKLIYSESVFIMIDSCIISKYPLTKVLSKIKNTCNLNNKNMILIVSQIHMTENYYKCANKEKYPCVNFNCLNYNLDLLEGKIEFKMKNILILETNIVFDNKILFQEEKKFLQLNKTWEFKDRNEINDNAQLELLIHMNKMFSKECYFVSRDNKLLQKVESASREISRLSAYHFF